MGFLERFFSGWDINTTFLAVCLVYLMKTERRIARLEGAVETMVRLELQNEEEE